MGAQDTVVILDPLVLRWVGQEVQIVEQRGDARAGAMELRVDYAGGRSDGTIAPDGAFGVGATRLRGLGRQGERRVIKTLRQRLDQAGYQVEIQPDARDGHGEDAKISVDGRVYEVQITMAPGDWLQAVHGSRVERGDRTTAVDWLRAAITSKVTRRPEALQNVILALDANHAGSLSANQVVEAYLETHGSPDLEFGFASVWVVGPTVPCCARIGDGRP